MSGASSVSFTIVRDRAPELFARLGGKPPLLSDGRPLDSFVWSRYSMRVQLLVFDSMRSGLRAEPGVQLLADRLRILMGTGAPALEAQP